MLTFLWCGLFGMREVAWVRYYERAGRVALCHEKADSVVGLSHENSAQRVALSYHRTGRV